MKIKNILKRDKSKYPENYRDPVWAFLMSIVLPGWGHLYIGKEITALIYILIGWSINIIWIYAIKNPYTLIFVFLFYFVYRLVAAIQATVVSKKLGDYQFHKLNKWYVYLLVLLIAYCVDFGLSEITADIVAPFPVFAEGKSMTKTIEHRDLLIFDGKYYEDHPIERGDIVNVLDIDQNSYIVKRVVALPGDTFQIRNGTDVYINKKRIEQPYAYFDSTYLETGDPLLRRMMNPPKIVIPNGRYYVLGDNRFNSFDSRFLGPASVDKISGKLMYRVYPLNKIKDFTK